MKILTFLKNNITVLILLLIIGLQLMILNQFSSHTSQQDLSKLEARFAGMQQDLNTLVSQQTYITTPSGVTVNISKNDIEQAVALAVKEALPGALVDNRNKSAQVSHQQSYIEAPLSALQEQTRFESQQAINQVIDKAVLMGRWTKQDTQDLLPHLGNLSTSQRSELIKRFTDAISNNQMQLDVPPPPL
ncbi:MAG: hypothetical protein HYZ31_06755 [Gammaproteobacteria bacterium]|jgi:hypothetical protein|nr:hypothetical protein [Gammaproteobacteria bacterium]